MLYYISNGIAGIIPRSTRLVWTASYKQASKTLLKAQYIRLQPYNILYSFTIKQIPDGLLNNGIHSKLFNWVCYRYIMHWCSSGGPT